MSLTKKIIEQHLVEGRYEPGRTMAVKIDQTLTQDATGTLAYLEFESLGLDRVRTETSVCFVDHNLLQADPKNADDHAFLRSVAAKFGVWFSGPGNGICHQVQLERFARSGRTLLGSDSHTPNAGAVGCLAMGAGGLDVAAAMAGQPFFLTGPKVLGVKLVGNLPDWISGKDVIHELLRRLTVKGGLGRVLEYFGPGVAQLNMAHRATICHMGAELGATGSVFPSDEITLAWLRAQGREEDWQALPPGGEADFDELEEIDLSSLVPLLALSPSPDNVVPVSEVAGQKVGQVIIGSSGNSGWYDLALAAKALEGKTVAPHVSFEINPGSRQVLSNLAADGSLANLIAAGARIHQSGCLGCIGMGQAPATGTISLRTFPRNFSGRSGTPNDQVHLVSPEIAVASALAGEIADPRDLGKCLKPAWPEKFILNDSGLVPPLPPEEAAKVNIVRGPHIAPFPNLDELPQDLEAKVVIKVGDNITTDDIMPGGANILPWRSNIDKICRFAFSNLDDCFADKAEQTGAGVIVGGENYGQGSSREHAALGPRHLGIRLKMAKSFARIHQANLINFGVLPLKFKNKADYEAIQTDDQVSIPGIRAAVLNGDTSLTATVGSKQIEMEMDLDDRQRQLIAAGGLLNYIKQNS